tara:strand:- start:19 stop:441 length:423 start_codon:yes stop_codon:yes gene_type:complete
MRFARIEDGSIVEMTDRLPNGARLPSGAWMVPYKREWSAAQMVSVGWFDVVRAIKPEGYSDSSVELVGGTPVEMWVSRAATEGELAMEARIAATAARKAAVADAVVVLEPIAALQGAANANMASVAVSLLAVIDSLAALS